MSIVGIVLLFALAGILTMFIFDAFAVGSAGDDAALERAKQEAKRNARIASAVAWLSVAVGSVSFGGKVLGWW